MAQLQTDEANSSDLLRRFNVISNRISENFQAHWEARPIGTVSRAAQFNWACAEGVGYSLAVMPALCLTNHSSGPVRAPKFHMFSSDQGFLLKIPGRSTLHVQPDELVIMASDMPCEIVNPRDYRTTALMIDGELFRAAVPDSMCYLGRPLRLKCKLEGVLRSSMDVAWELSQAGLFATVGPKLVHALLEVLSALPLPADGLEDHRSCDALGIRRRQAKAFIEKHFASPELTVASMASQLNVSQRYLQMAFREEQVTPLECLRKHRLDAAARLLRDRSQLHRSITDISFSCGFNSSAHFSTEFRREYAVSPRQYRSVQLSEQGG